jgi:hypothetical protein
MQAWRTNFNNVVCKGSILEFCCHGNQKKKKPSTPNEISNVEKDINGSVFFILYEKNKLRAYIFV